MSAKLRLPLLLLLLDGAMASAADHPLDTVTRHLPTVTATTQVTEVDGSAVIVSINPQGTVLREAPDGRFLEVPTGLPAVSQLHERDGTWCGMAAGKLWRSTAWPVWEEIAQPAAEPLATVKVLNGEWWGWTWGGLRWNNGTATRIYPKLYRSADLDAWTEVIATPDSAALAQSFSDLEWAAGRYVLAGDAYQRVDGVFRHAGGLWTSADGVSWQREDEVDGTYTSVTHGSNGWLAGGTGQTYAVSSDGTTWTTREHPFVSYYIGHEYGSWPVYSALNDVVWLSSGYHALVSGQFGSQVVVSADGIHWSQGTALAYDDFPGTPHLAAVADKAWLWGNGSTVWSSDDWRWGAQRILPEEPSDWHALAASAERAVVLGDEGRAGWSADGEHWNFIPLPGSGSLPAAAVWAADRGEFLAVGTSGDPEAMRVWRSVDGAVWGSRLASGCRTPIGLVRGCGKYVTAMADGWIMHSPDGLAWNYAAIDVPAATPWLSQPEPLQGLAYDGVMFVGVKLRGGLVVSTDGVEWTSRAGPRQYDSDVKATVCGAGGLWLYTDNWNSFLSEDLGTWHLSPTGTSSQALIHAFGEFIGIGGSSLESSADGVSWTQRAEMQGLTHLTPFKNTVLLAGENGLLCQSAPWSDFVAAWLAEHFTTTQLADPQISGDDRDPDGDGLPNLLEYACGLDPLLPDARAVIRHYDMYYATQGQETDRYLVLEFPSWESSPGISAWVEHSPDLRTWSRGGLRSDYAWGPNGYKKINDRYVWTRELKVDAAAGFLRLRAERAATRQP